MRRWIGSGACQSPGGAFYAWVDETTGAPAFEYPEITGYALTYLAGRDGLTADEERAARRAAGWLLARLDAGDLTARDGWDEGAVYVFDLAMIATGLVAHGERLGDERALAGGVALAGMIQGELGPGGVLDSISRVSPAGSRRTGTWSTSGRAHLLKVVQCLLAAGAHGLDGAVEAAGAIVEGSRSLQAGDGRFTTVPGADEVMLHPHLYAAEGLWIWGTAQGDGEALARSRAAVEWAFGLQLESAGFPRSVAGGEAAVEQSDVTSQALRLAALHGVAPKQAASARDRLAAILRKCAEGQALPYQPAAPVPHLNVWATLFAAQAFDVAGGAGLAWPLFV